MAEQCAATNLKPLYLSKETPSFYTWTSAIGFAKGKERLRNHGFFVNGSSDGLNLTSKSKGHFTYGCWMLFLSDSFDFLLFDGQLCVFLKE